MRIIQSIEDIKHDGPYLISGRVLSIEKNIYTIVIKWNLSAKLIGHIPEIQVDDYISVSLQHIDGIEEMAGKTFITSKDFSLITDMKTTLSAFRQHHSSIDNILGLITDDTLLCILKQVLYKEISIDCPVWDEARHLRVRYHTVPSARTYHHAYIGGNFIHSIGVASTAHTLGKHKGISGLPLEMLVAGGLIHDIGKLMAFTPIKKGHILTIRPTTIKIKEHIDIGLDIMDKIHDFLSSQYQDSDKLDVIIQTLKGFIETHHGLKSWGAKREPESILEQILFVSDYIDSRTGNYNPLMPVETDTLIEKLSDL
ncbi:HD domain-containing protein [bacterium 3DAC]|nr:HD domain-containing protein [bacterium 3DAC]